MEVLWQQQPMKVSAREEVLARVWRIDGSKPVASQIPLCIGFCMRRQGFSTEVVLGEGCNFRRDAARLAGSSPPSGGRSVHGNYRCADSGNGPVALRAKYAATATVATGGRAGTGRALSSGPLPGAPRDAS